MEVSLQPVMAAEMAETEVLVVKVEVVAETPRGQAADLAVMGVALEVVEKPLGEDLLTNLLMMMEVIMEAKMTMTKKRRSQIWDTMTITRVSTRTTKASKTSTPGLTRLSGKREGQRHS